MERFRLACFGFASAVCLMMPALAIACEVCSVSVLLNETRAQCILESGSTFAEDAAASLTGFVVINMDTCSYDSDGSRGVVEGSKTKLEEPPDQTLVLDADGFACLQRLIEDTGDALSPEKEFNLLAAC